MEIKTRGFATSEFWLIIITTVLLVGITIAENTLGWKIDPRLHDLLWGLLPTAGVYTLGRSWFKGKKIEAISRTTKS